MTVTDVATYAIDELAPRRVASARSIAEVVAVLHEANESGEAVVPVGGATRLAVGNAPRRYDVALDVSALAGIVEHEPGDLTATVRAGTTLASLGAHLARHGQMWPVEVGLPERATVGGVLAGAAAGPSRLVYFHPRDWVVGVGAVLGDGTLTKAGGKVVKNVTGYDLTRFYAGSYGTLCVLVEASLKLWPLPEAERTLLAPCARLEDGVAALDELRRERVALDAAALLDRDAGMVAGLSDAPCHVAVRLRGTRRAVDRLAEQLARALPATAEAPATPWGEIAAAPQRASVVLRLTAPQGRIAPLLRRAGPGVLYYHGTGIAFLLRDAVTAAWVRERRAEAEAAEGSLVVERAPAALKAEVDAWGAPALPLDLARRIKDALDPRGVLSPGRFAGGL